MRARPAITDQAPTRLLSLPLALTFLVEFTSLSSFFLLPSVLPMLAAAAGASTGAGLVTGSLLLGTVIAEAAASALIGRFGYRPAIGAGAVLLGAPALALLPREPQAVMMSVSFVRGLGFGFAGSALARSPPRCFLPDGAVKGSACLASLLASRPWSHFQPGSGSPDSTWPRRSRPWRQSLGCCH
jgi:MFS family permease